MLYVTVYYNGGQNMLRLTYRKHSFFKCPRNYYFLSFKKLNWIPPSFKKTLKNVKSIIRDANKERLRKPLLTQPFWWWAGRTGSRLLTREPMNPQERACTLPSLLNGVCNGSNAVKPHLPLENGSTDSLGTQVPTLWKLS